MPILRKAVSPLFAALLALGATAAHADDVEGEIEAVDAEAKTFTVQGITFATDERTDYDDGLQRFEDLAEGQRVEVDFEYRDQRHLAREIELEEQDQAKR